MGEDLTRFRGNNGICRTEYKESRKDDHIDSLSAQ